MCRAFHRFLRSFGPERKRTFSRKKRSAFHRSDAREKSGRTKEARPARITVMGYSVRFDFDGSRRRDEAFDGIRRFVAPAFASDFLVNSMRVVAPTFATSSL